MSCCRFLIFLSWFFTWCPKVCSLPASMSGLGQTQGRSDHTTDTARGHCLICPQHCIVLSRTVSAIVARIVSVPENYLGLTRSAAPPPPTLTPEGNSVRQGSGGVTTGACNCRWPPALMRPSSPPPPSTPQPNWLHVQLISGSEHCFYVTSSYVRGTPTPCWITSNQLTLRLYIITSPGSHIPILFLSPRLFAGVTTCLGIAIVFSSPAEVCFFLLFQLS